MGNKYPVCEQNESPVIKSIYKTVAASLAVLMLGSAACNKPPPDENKKVEVPTVAEKAKEYKTATSQDEYKRLEEAIRKFYHVRGEIEIVNVEYVPRERLPVTMDEWDKMINVFYKKKGDDQIYLVSFTEKNGEIY